MKCLSLMQPWATLVAISAKRIETRSWSTSYRGPLAIHASKGFPKWAKDTCFESRFFNSLLKARFADVRDLPLGAVIATCRLVDWMPTELLVNANTGINAKIVTEQELAFGDYSPGRFAWILEDVKMLPKPIPAKGALGLWEWEPTTNAAA